MQVLLQVTPFSFHFQNALAKGFDALKCQLDWLLENISDDVPLPKLSLLMPFIESLMSLKQAIKPKLTPSDLHKTSRPNISRFAQSVEAVVSVYVFHLNDASQRDDFWSWSLSLDEDANLQKAKEPKPLPALNEVIFVSV